MNPHQISDQLARALVDVDIAPPVSHVYHPLVYARAPHHAYLERFGQRRPRPYILVGMNPGPFGMAQTGVPFGAVSFVRDWMGIQAPVAQPESFHPARPVEGFACRREEVSGARLWAWARDRFQTPEAFFAHFFVHNYCPLLFLDAGGANRTPPQLKKSERDAIFAPCDEALRQLANWFEPEVVIGVGDFALQRIQAALVKDFPHIRTGRILHPSPASPKANLGWARQAELELEALGVELD